MHAGPGVAYLEATNAHPGALLFSLSLSLALFVRTCSVLFVLLSRFCKSKIRRTGLL